MLLVAGHQPLVHGRHDLTTSAPAAAIISVSRVENFGSLYDGSRFFTEKFGGCVVPLKVFDV